MYGKKESLIALDRRWIYETVNTFVDSYRVIFICDGTFGQKH